MGPIWFTRHNYTLSWLADSTEPVTAILIAKYTFVHNSRIYMLTYNIQRKKLASPLLNLHTQSKVSRLPTHTKYLVQKCLQFGFITTPSNELTSYFFFKMFAVLNKSMHISIRSQPIKPVNYAMMVLSISTIWNKNSRAKLKTWM